MSIFRVGRLDLRTRRRAAGWLLGVCAAGLGPPCLADERPDAEARLEALRNALVDQALQAPVQVRSAAWIDESGRLRESTEIRANLRVRGVRVESYVEEDKPAKQAGAAQNSSGPPPVPTATADLECRPPHGRYRRHAALLDNPSQAAMAGYHFLPELAAHARQTLLTGFAAQEGWLVSPVMAANSAWERALTDAGNAHVTPYLMRLQLEPQTPDTAASKEPTELPQALRGTLGRLLPSDDRLPERPARLSLQILERSSGRQLWADAVLIAYPRTEVTLVRQPLPRPMLETVAQVVHGWREALTMALACEPLRFTVSAAGDGQYAIEAGSLEGLRMGDQFLLVDKARFPSRILESGPASRPTLIEVRSLSPQRAIARLVAGPPPAPLQTVLAQPF